MHIARVKTYSEFIDLEQAWDNLLANAATSTVFLTHEWILSWWKAYGGDRELSIIVLKDKEDVRAIAPLMLTDFKVLRRLSFIGSNRPDYCDFIVHKLHPAYYQMLLRYLYDDFTAWDEIVFENVPETSPLIEALEQERPRFIVKKRVSDVCPYVRIDVDPENLLRKIEKSQFLGKKLKRLRKLGIVTFRHYTESSEMENALSSLLKAHFKRFDERNLNKRFPQELEFHKELLQRMHQKDMIRFAVLELDGQPIAQHFGFGYNGVYYYVRPSFDPSYSEYSPGLVLLYHLIEYAARNGYVEFDFLRGKETYKQRMADQSRRVMIVNLYRSFPKRLLCMGGTRIKRFFQRSAFRQT